jgi:multiple sugar transport system ATP-binding protein
MVAIRLEGVSKSFGETEVLRSVDLEIRDSEFIVFVGPSGCGKSTLLRLIAGLEAVSGGDIWFDDRRITKVAAAKRGVAMVFQSYALYPHMTVAENMTMSLRLAGRPKAERRKRAEEVAAILQLAPYLDRKPSELSGGQRQRVAIGRAIVREPDVYLFDEPLSNLDAALRVETRVEISKLHRRLGHTMIYVTHDQVEAMTMADRIVILDGGRIAQVGSPLDLYRRPANRFVAGFIGSPKMNFLDVADLGDSRGTRNVAIRDGGTIDIASLRPDRTVTALGIRPEHLTLADNGPIRGTVAAVERLGSETLVYVENNGNTIIVKAGERTSAEVGRDVKLRPDLDAIHLFSADGCAIGSSIAGNNGGGFSGN